MQLSRTWQRIAASDFGILLALAFLIILLHTLTKGQYGFHRDELLTLNNARHLDWGYVLYPPMTPFLRRVELELFGTSLRGFRFFAAISQGLVLLLTGLAARELGQARSATRGCLGSRNRWNLPGCWVVPVLYDVRLSVVGAGGLLCDPPPQVG